MQRALLRRRARSTASRSMPPPSSRDRDADRVLVAARVDHDVPALGLAGRRAAPRATRCRGRRRCARGARAGRRAGRGSSGRARARRRASSTSTLLPIERASSRARRGSVSRTRSSGAVRSESARRCSSPTARSMRSKPTATSAAEPLRVVPATVRTCREVSTISPTASGSGRAPRCARAPRAAARRATGRRPVASTAAGALFLGRSPTRIRGVSFGPGSAGRRARRAGARAAPRRRAAPRPSRAPRRPCARGPRARGRAAAGPRSGRRGPARPVRVHAVLERVRELA